MSALVKSEFVTLLSALETTLGVQATTAWLQHQPNPGGLQAFYPNLKKVARSPLSKNLQDEKGAVVGLGTSPKVVHDLSRDFIEQFREAAFRSATKQPSSTGQSKFLPTGVTATGYTVAANGALAQNILILAAGFTNQANNGLKVLAAASIGTEIKTAGLVVEAAPPAGACVYVVGVQGASADIAVNAAGNLTSAANIFTTLGLQVGMWIWLGGGTAATPGALGFATAADRGFARITAIAAGILSVDRRSSATAAAASWAADTGTGKTIQIFYGPWVRNVAGDNVDYKEPSYSLELSEPGAAAAAATDFVYGLGCCLNTLEFNAPSEDKVVVTASFVGTNFTDPSTSRASGASTATLPFANQAFTTADQVRRLRVANVDETGISIDILDWKLTINNNVKPQVQQGTLGAVRMIFGKFQVKLDITCVFIQDDVCKAIRDNRTCSFDTAVASGDGALLFDVPSIMLDDGAPDIRANEEVTLPTTAMAFRDSTYNFTCGMQLFPFLPPS
jgi:hypothetical protein